MLLHDLQKKNLIHPPKFLADNTTMLTVMGSQAYGVSNDDSDHDIYGVCIPPKDLIFPHLAGEIPGFGRQIQRFDVWQEHRVRDNALGHFMAEKNLSTDITLNDVEIQLRGQESLKSGKFRDLTPDELVKLHRLMTTDQGGIERDFSVYSIVKYFQLCMENNPNMIDSLFVPRTAVIHMTKVGEHIRENRKMFLHKGAWHKFKGYAYAQANKIEHKVNSSNPKRAATIEKHGYDVKFAYHCVRLMNEVEQILVEGDLDLQRNREQLKSIRRGDWKLEDFKTYFANKENALELAYANSHLPHGPDEDKIKMLLLECLEMHYGSLSDAVRVIPPIESLVSELSALVNRFGGRA